MLVGSGVYFDHAASDGVPERTAAVLEGELARESASPEVRRMAQWAVSTQDHAGMPFVVVDKADGRIFAFDPRGRLRGTAPVLLGPARADQAASPAVPAGRFVADTLASARGGGIVWANAKTQVTLYALPSAQARPPQRPQAEAKRVSTSTMLVAAGFYRECLDPLRTQPSIAYVLPEMVDQVGAGRGDYGRSPS
ncbi:hypothetical protein GCM10027034_27760 [Ramlibacter solisilvae]